MKPVVLDDAVWEGVDAGVEALVESWQVAPGDGVAAGQTVATVVLVKATLDVAAPAAGRIESILVPAGATFPRGAVLATVREAP